MATFRLCKHFPPFHLVAFAKFSRHCCCFPSLAEMLFSPAVPNGWQVYLPFAMQVASTTFKVAPSIFLAQHCIAKAEQKHIAIPPSKLRWFKAVKFA
ncbi:hypothetical protein NPIL_456191 [Nephila pilipes]|uniref:Uncharacterized protein n=1 Tax=Nephila pilipes TaxID=299642 RepID=A0A8X6PDN3_NEPPI|nr:hypothetical protein NPIL_456191 [Nephila pilipes]